MTQHYQYSFIGAGNMSKGIIAGMIAAGIDPKSILTSTKTAESGKKLVEAFGVNNTQNNNDCLNAEVIVLAVKPQILSDVLSQLAVENIQNQLIVSVIAGVPCKVYQQYLGKHIKIIRTMPNMPAKIGQGMTGMYAENCQQTDKEKANLLMQGTGKTLWLENESGIDYVNAISGSGPAYVYAFIHHLAQAGEQLGLSYGDALTLSLQTVIGSAKLAEIENDGTPESMQSLIGQITSKGGTTFEAMQSFEKDNYGKIIDNAVQKCYARAVELGKKYQ